MLLQLAPIMVAAAVPPGSGPPATTPPARLEKRDQVTLGGTFQGYTLNTSGDTTIWQSRFCYTQQTFFSTSSWWACCTSGVDCLIITGCSSNTVLYGSSSSTCFCATVPLYSSPGAQSPLLGLGCNTFASTLYMQTAALPTAPTTLSEPATTPPTLPAPAVTVTAAAGAPAGAIAGGVLGGVALLAVLALACFFAAAALRRRGRSRRGRLAWLGGGGGGGGRGREAGGELSSSSPTTEVVHAKHNGGAPPPELPAAGPLAAAAPAAASEAGEMPGDAASGEELRYSLPANYSPSPVLQEARAVPLQRVCELPAGLAISELPDVAARDEAEERFGDDHVQHLGVAI